jgi:hypothetical protein
MKSKPLKLVISLILFFIVSCEEPETLVTDIIHRDGSITREIVMRKTGKKFKLTDIQVPLDNSWIFSDSCEISPKGDTTWVKRASKEFKNTDEINLAYKADSGCNKKFSRHAAFSKKFRWFNTIYRFSETIEKRMKYGYPVSDFLNSEELQWFYSPYSDNESNLRGPDSLKYKSVSDSVNIKKDRWINKCIVSEWVGEFSGQLNNPDIELSYDSLKNKEDRILDIVMRNEKDFDNLWTSGYILKQFIGESNALKYRSEADTALDIVENRVTESFAGYSVRISMPGTLTASNGFADSSKILIWPVTDEYFFADDYEMWAESKEPNLWAWIASGAFVLFVLTGIIIRKKKRG